MRCFCIRWSTNLLHFWIYKLPMHTRSKNGNRMDVFHGKRNKLVQTLSCSQSLNEFWLYWISSSAKVHSIEATSMLLQHLWRAYQLNCPSSVYWLMNASQKPDDHSRCDNAYRKLFFCHWLAHGALYTCTVKFDASFSRMSLLQIKHFPRLSFADRNGFLISSINIQLLT